MPAENDGDAEEGTAEEAAPKEKEYEAVNDAKALWTRPRKEVSDDELRNASNVFHLNTPRNKEEYYYRTIFSDHFSSKAASLSVPSVPSVACSTPQALEWDEAFKNMNDPSGRSISNIHNESYE